MFSSHPAWLTSPRDLKNSPFLLDFLQDEVGEVKPVEEFNLFFFFRPAVLSVEFSMLLCKCVGAGKKSFCRHVEKSRLFFSSGKYIISLYPHWAWSFNIRFWLVNSVKNVTKAHLFFEKQRRWTVSVLSLQSCLLENLEHSWKAQHQKLLFAKIKSDQH